MRFSNGEARASCCSRRRASRTWPRSGGSTRRTPTTCGGRSRSRSWRDPTASASASASAPDGTVVTPLTDEELERVAAWVAPRVAGTEGDLAVAVSLLFAFADSTHERRLAAFLEQRFPGLPISASHRAAPVWREHERGTTTIVDAYLTPVAAPSRRRPRVGPGGARLLGPRLDHEVERRADARRGKRQPGGTDGAVGPRGRDRRRTPLRARGGSTQRRHLGHGRDERRHRARPRGRDPVRRRTSSSSSGCRSPRPRSTWSRSAPAAGRSPGSTTAACSGSGREAPGPSPGRPATPSAARSPR